MPTGIIFYDSDGQPVSTGDQVNIGFIVTSAVKLKADDRFLTVTLVLKHNAQGMKFKIDNGQEFHTAPSCIVTKS